MRMVMKWLGNGWEMVGKWLGNGWEMVEKQFRMAS